MNILIGIGVGWFVLVVVYVVFFNKKKKTKIIEKKKIKENSPIKREYKLTKEAKKVDDIIDSGNLSVLIKWNESETINPELLVDLEEDIQDVIFRANRGEKKNEKVLSSVKKEVDIDSNKYKNLINS